MTNSLFLRKIRSFVRRDSRMTEAQRQAYQRGWPCFGLSLDGGQLNLEQVFGRKAPCILEIGFGSGQSLLAMAKAHPEIDFIGVETYLPGVGALLLGMERDSLTNIRIFNADAVEVLEQSVPYDSLEGVQIFFPDPWQKRKHHKRRLIQPDFINTVLKRLKKGGLLHLATDWEDYAMHMLRVLTENHAFTNLAGPGQFASRSAHRPLITKFEQRGLRSGREIWELQLTRLS